MAACGLDFGTSNTTLGTLDGGRAALVPLEDGQVTIPSAIFYNPVRTPLVGRAAIAAYVEGSEGRLMRSIKSVLGSALLDEKTIASLKQSADNLQQATKALAENTKKLDAIVANTERASHQSATRFQT